MVVRNTDHTPIPILCLYPHFKILTILQSTFKITSKNLKNHNSVQSAQGLGSAPRMQRWNGPAEAGTRYLLGRRRQLCSNDFRSQWEKLAGGPRGCGSTKELQRKVQGPQYQEEEQELETSWWWHTKVNNQLSLEIPPERSLLQ